MKTKRILIPSFALLFSLVLSACVGTVTPPATLDTNHAATAVAGTMTAFVDEPTTTATDTPHELPTASSTPASQAIRAVFVGADDNVYTWTPGESSFTQITRSGDAVTALLSSDGNLIAFTRITDSQAYSLNVVRSDGSDQRTLFSHDQFSALTRPEIATNSKPEQVEWVPNTHMLSMNVSYVIEGPGLQISSNLTVFDVDHGTYQNQLNVTGLWKFAYSPDGLIIVASQPDGIDLYKSDGTPFASPKFFTFTNIDTASESPFIPDVFWSKDSKSFAFTIPPVEPFKDAPSDTRVIKVDATDATYTTTLSTPMNYQGVAEFSPDLSKIAYTTNVDSSSSLVNLHIANVDGSGDKIIETNVNVNKFSWSPDNLHFIYSLKEGTNIATFMGQIGSKESQITQVVSLREVKWVDDTQYLILDLTPEGWKIWFGTIGSAPVPVYSNSTTDEPLADRMSVNR